jgi:hypothetical protein
MSDQHTPTTNTMSVRRGPLALLNDLVTAGESYTSSEGIEGAHFAGRPYTEDCALAEFNYPSIPVFVPESTERPPPP